MGARMKRLAFLVLALSACAAPASEQGRSALGGSVTMGPPISVTVNIGTNGEVSTSATTAPTAAPAASSTAEAKQEAKATTDVKADATIPAGGVPALNGVVPTPTPGE